MTLIMKAIILNSGLGKRMGPLSRHNPKCLIEISQDETILSRQIRILSQNGINSIIMTTGPFENKIKKYIAQHFPSLNIDYVKNPKYATTNYIYSLFLISHEIINEDIILMHGDMVFEDKILKLIISQNENCVLVNNNIPPPKKDFKGKIVNGTVKEIGVDLFGSNCHLLMPLYKLNRAGFLLWMDEIGRFINSGKTTVYAENAFNRISDELTIIPIYFNDELCMEIDIIEDLTLVRTLLKKRD